MRSILVTGFSMLLMAFGFVSVIWVSSSLLGAAHSQQPVQPQAVAPSAPTLNLPPASQPVSQAESTVPPTFTNDPSEILTNEYAPSSVTTEGYVYDPTGRRDPFKPYAPEVKKSQQPTQGEVVISSDPLQIYDLAQYSLVGVLWDTKNPRAMVKDPQGKLFPLRKETKIGRNNGFVSMIREGAVLVVEPAFGDNGLQTAVTRVLLLSK